MAKTANQRLFDETVRHHVSLLRFGEGQADEAARILAEAEEELLGKITGAMAKGLSPSRFEELLVSIRERRAEVLGEVGRTLEESLAGLGQTDAEWEEGSIQGASPVQLNLASVPAEAVRAAVASPINGIPLSGWIESMATREMQSLQQAVSLALVQGETIDDLVRRIRGTRANGYQDGILSTTTRNAQALARTAVNHASNAARELVWEANSDIVRALRWTSTLDGRTSTICGGRDGKLAPIGGGALLPTDPQLVPPGARPPAHFNCRSLMVAVLDGIAIAGDRPFVADARTRAAREKDFRRQTKEEGISIQDVRRRWAEKHVGSVASDTDYDTWLRSQGKAVQDSVLGPARADLFRGGAPIDRFADASGRRLNLDELRDELGL